MKRGEGDSVEALRQIWMEGYRASRADVTRLSAENASLRRRIARLEEAIRLVHPETDDPCFCPLCDALSPAAPSLAPDEPLKLEPQETLALKARIVQTGQAAFTYVDDEAPSPASAAPAPDETRHTADRRRLAEGVHAPEAPAAPKSTAHGNHEIKCLCPGCPTMVPSCWAAGMCALCANEVCEHADEGAPKSTGAVEQFIDERHVCWNGCPVPCPRAERPASTPRACNCGADYCQADEPGPLPHLPDCAKVRAREADRG